MNEIELFDFEGNDVRAVVLHDEPWLVASDVARALGYERPNDAVRQHVDEEDRGSTVIRRSTSGGNPNATILNESGVYALIFGSKLDSARAFKRWVTSEVLPTLRQHGVYVDPNSNKDDTYIEAEVQRQLEKRQYKAVIRDTLKSIGTESGWQYGEVRNIVFRAVCGMKAPELLASGRDLQTWQNEKPRKADHEVATNYLFADELELFNVITDAVAVDLRFRKPRNYQEFLIVVRDAADRYTA